jgi:hypothetical protein
VHFGRIDYQDREKRKADKALEVIWRGSRTFGFTSQVLFLFLRMYFTGSYIVVSLQIVSYILLVSMED